MGKAKPWAVRPWPTKKLSSVQWSHGKWSDRQQDLPWKWIISSLLLSGLLILALEHYTSVDLMLEDWFFDASLHDFPWRNHWFATDFAHGSFKSLLVYGGTGLLMLVVLDLVYKQKWLPDFWRWRLQILAWASVLIPAVIRGIKRLSPLNCPWSIDRYGGDVPYLKLFDHIPQGWQAGHCFPAGHASTGLWLAALVVIYLPAHPRKALVLGMGGLGVGLALGWIQQMRGAHFLSHTLVSAWLACLIVTLLIFAYEDKLLRNVQKN